VRETLARSERGDGVAQLGVEEVDGLVEEPVLDEHAGDAVVRGVANWCV
jgi:hypothetical protein